MRLFSPSESVPRFAVSDLASNPPPKALARRKHDVFLSHSDADTDDIVAKLILLLEDKDVDLVNMHKFSASYDWNRHIKELILDSKVFIVIWTPNSIESSEVQGEVEAAFALWADAFPDRKTETNIIQLRSGVSVDQIPIIKARNLPMLDITDWKGGVDNPQIKRLLDSLSFLLGKNLGTDQYVGDISRKDRRNSVREFVRLIQADLERIDTEFRWSDQSYTPLEAVFELDPVSARRHGQKRGKAKLVDKILEMSREKFFFIKGDPGSGKSVALRNLCRRYLRNIKDPRSVTRQTPIPIYINLKEWIMPPDWTPDDPVPTNALSDFVVSHLLGSESRASCDVRLLRVFFKEKFEEFANDGKLIFVFDSFDEAPAILDAGTRPDVIDELSQAIWNFIHNRKYTRGVLASRVQRAPRFRRHTPPVQLTVRPFDERLIQEFMGKWGGLPERILNDLFNNRPDLLVLARNPFTANLIAEYVFNRNNLPTDRAILYEDFVEKRISKLESKLKPRNLDTETVVAGAIEIAHLIFQESKFGLELPVGFIEESLPHIRAREICDILVEARIARMGSLDQMKFSFVHRRFHEYFIVRYLEQNRDVIDLSWIPHDRRWREPLVLYAEIAETREARRIAVYCWTQISEGFDDHDVSYRHPDWIKKLYCLRFLIDSFSRRVDAIEPIQEKLGDFVDRCFKSGEAVTKKQAVEAIGLLSPDACERALYLSMEYGDAWVRQTAIESCKLIPELRSSMVRMINRHFLDMEDLTFLDRSSGEYESFALIDRFYPVSDFIRARARHLRYFYPAAIAGMLVNSYALFVGFMATFSVLLDALTGDAELERMTNNFRRAFSLWYVIFAGGLLALAFITFSYSVLPETVTDPIDRVFAIFHQESDGGQETSQPEAGVQAMLEQITIGWTVLSLSLLGFAWDAMGWPLSDYIDPLYPFFAVWLIVLWFARPRLWASELGTDVWGRLRGFLGLRQAATGLLGVVIIAIVFLLIILLMQAIAYLYRLVFGDSGIGQILLAVVVILLMAFVFVVPTASHAKKWVHDRRWLRNSIAANNTIRSAIAANYLEFKLESKALTYLDWLSENVLEVTGEWPNDKLPRKIGFDRANGELARLEEQWLGLDLR